LPHRLLLGCLRRHSGLRFPVILGPRVSVRVVVPAVLACPSDARQPGFNLNWADAIDPRRHSPAVAQPVVTRDDAVAVSAVFSFRPYQGRYLAGLYSTYRSPMLISP